MDVLLKYKWLIIALVGLIAEGAVAEYRLTKIEADHKATTTEAKKEREVIKLAAKADVDDAKAKAEAAQKDLNTEIGKLKEKEVRTAVLQANQNHMKENMSEMKDTLKEILNEIRDSRNGK